MSRVYQLAPSILSADFNRLGEQIQRVEKAECRWLHIDIMDGMFVPSISFGMPVVKSIRKESSLYFDVHMMVKDPERYVEEFQSCGADMITVHAEACRDLAETVKKIHETGADAGVAVNPDTPLSAVTDVMDQVEMILIMSVYPGFGGQKYIPESTERNPVSGLLPLTLYALLTLGFPSPPVLNTLSSPVTITRRTILQKVPHQPLTVFECL